VYGDGRSEQLLAQLRRDTRAPFHVATKAGRRAQPHGPAAYSLASLTGYIERSLKNLEVDALDLLQLHCPPTDVYYMPEVFDGLDRLVQDGKLRFYGVSVERVEEALKAIEYPNVSSVQIIFNIFRQRPADLFFARARERQVGILARLPLSSGMLAGKMTAATSLPLTITGRSTAMARRSIAARRSRGSTTRSAWRRSRSCARWSRRASPWPSSPWRGSSSTRR